ncbi:MAG: S1C family serine protease [Phycisphaerae bacterium]
MTRRATDHRRRVLSGTFAVAFASAWACAPLAAQTPTAAPPPAPSAAAVDDGRETPDAAAAAALLAAQPQVFRAALAAIAPSVVRIETIGGAQPAAREDDPRRGASAFRQADSPTTGVIWSADGLIVTSSFNFIRDPSIITVTLADERRYVAKLVARDHPARIALLKIAPEKSGDAPLPTPTLALPPDVRVGQWALVAGYGHGSATPAVSVGCVSALNRANGLALQTDAKTSPANYGGPVFDIAGRLLGICVPMAAGEDELAGVAWYDSGIGFAIPPARIMRHLDRLARGEDVRRGFLGVTLAPELLVGEEPTTRPSSPRDGLRIVGQVRGPAADAGLRVDDVITHLDDQRTPRLIELRRALWSKAAGESIAVTVRRGDEVVRVEFELVSENAFATPRPPAPDAATQPGEREPTTQPVDGAG